jgi:hypothetical protein
MLLVVTLILSIIAPLSVAATWTPPSTPPYTWMYVEDYEFVSESDLTNTTFDVDVYIYNVSRLGDWQFTLEYNTTLLDATTCTLTTISNMYTESLLPSPWTPTKGIDDSLGKVSFGAGYPNGAYYDSPFNGSGSLLTITFKITYAPPYETVIVPENKSVSCALDLTVLALDSLGPGPDYDVDPISHGVDDGSYTWIRPQKLVGAPTAVCSVTPSTVYVGDTVTFDGTGSDDGGAPPLSYAWDVNSDGSVEYTTATVVVPCPTAGDFNVTLTVTNNKSMSDSADPQFWTVKEKLGPLIDLYTSRNRWCGVETDEDMVGKGDDVPCDALSPDVNITLFAEVTYNGAPVNHVFVAFEVLWEWEVDWYHQETPWVLQNSCVLYATAETNKDGIAQVSFRVPTSCDPTEFIGKWFAMAKCKVQQVPIEDTMRFDVGYLIMMYDIEVLREVEPDTWEPDTVFVREEDCLGVIVYIKSIAWIPRFAKFILVAYDECNVPLGQVIVGFDVPPGYYCDPMHGFVMIYDLCIPQYAYVGMGGRVEVSVFTELPHACGVPYSKGISAPIEITWAGA